jgi:hypothetical protein
MSFPVAALSKTWNAFAHSNAGIVGSNPTWGMDVCVRFFCVCVVLCVGSGLATDWYPVQGVLPTVWKIKKLKKRPRSNKGLYSHRQTHSNDELKLYTNGHKGLASQKTSWCTCGNPARHINKSLGRQYTSLKQSSLLQPPTKGHCFCFSPLLLSPRSYWVGKGHKEIIELYFVTAYKQTRQVNFIYDQ